jgi:hypothetical protein
MRLTRRGRVVKYTLYVVLAVAWFALWAFVPYGWWVR